VDEKIPGIVDRVKTLAGGRTAKVIGCLAFATGVLWFSGRSELESPARWTLFVVALAAAMWATEAIPAFAVALLVIGLLIMILGQPSSILGEGPGEWEIYAATLGSPLIWLFFGGFVLAAAADKTGLSRVMAREVLRRFGTHPKGLLAGGMTVTFFSSMFISNTAAATMMIAVMMPILGVLPQSDRFRRGLLLGIAFAANVGGMGTVIGSPPNAIAAGALQAIQPIDFFGWMLAAVPPALASVVLIYLYLVYRYPASVSHIDLSGFVSPVDGSDGMANSRKGVIVVFLITVGLWLTQSLHGVPAPVVAFFPICAFCSAGILNDDDICAIRWDVLLLIAGGLSLGLAVTQTGVAVWMVGLLPLGQVPQWVVVSSLAFVTMAVSNVMSNTAAANILVPIGIAMGAGNEAATVIPMALSASAAMCLPISTPPNAIAYGTGQLRSWDLIEGGLWIGIVVPILASVWGGLILGH
jgi:sodium-dependent dicarboxylate transporter 2/3/5